MTRTDLTVDKRPSGVVIVSFAARSKENFLTSEIIDEIRHTLEELKNDKSVTAVGFMSGKNDTFLSGADLHELIKLDSREPIYALARKGQSLFDLIADFPKPTVVGIHGACLGGGVEMTLCCNRRIATSAPETKFGLPEVKLGLLPGLGGTQRLPRLVDLRTAVEFILSSETVTAERALEMGLIDEIVDVQSLPQRVEQLLCQLAKEQKEGKFQPSSKTPQALLEEKQASFFKMMERSIRIRTKGNYPAPQKVIECVRYGLENGIEKGLEFEANAFADLAITDVSRNLIFLLFTTEFAKLSAASQAQRMGTAKIETVAVLGSGLMGTSIAHLAAANGLKVIIKSLSAERQQQAFDRLKHMLERSDHKASASSVALLVERVSIAEKDEDLKRADLVIEALAEDIDLKVEVLERVIPHLKAGCVIATNTSSLSVNEIAARLKTDHDVVGLHFFHPVDKMMLVEVIPSTGARKESMAKVLSFITDLGRIPLAVKDSTCFLVNKLICTYILEAARLAECGEPINWIDEAPGEFGMPMGPWLVTDEVGYDVAYLVAKSLEKAYGDRFKNPRILGILDELNITGKKSGTGIYIWDESGKNTGFNPRIIPACNVRSTDEKLLPEKAHELAERMILPMVDEAARCLEEKIVRRPREIDLASVVGMGFPPFRGGLLRYADRLGIAYVRKRLEEIYAQSGHPRSVSQYLINMERDGRTFYSRGKESDEG
ncbi:MAG TPA: 3-hydroxyacyl-CoA dehydrogenase NAD-binding domain-containing protein [Candidatus Obscuribacterales bacterium]